MIVAVVELIADVGAAAAATHKVTRRSFLKERALEGYKRWKIAAAAAMAAGPGSFS